MKLPTWPLTLIAASAAASSCWRESICNGPLTASFPGPWESNNFAPNSRIISPKSQASLSDMTKLSNYSTEPITILNSTNPAVVFDFGLEVGGLSAFDYVIEPSNSALTRVGLSFTEARDFVGRRGDNSLGNSVGEPGDGPLIVNLTTTRVNADNHFAIPDRNLRGGFRYMTVFLDSPSSETHLEIRNVTLELSIQPTWPNLRAYQGYFHSDDELLNKIWYSGAYTVQTNSAPGNTGRNNRDAGPSDWRNDAFITTGQTVLLDGAKRDRWVWIGDMGVAVPSAFVSTGDLESTKYALLSIYDNQNANGTLPKAGPPYVRWDSDTYHLWALIGMYNYFLYSGDEDLVRDLWPKHEAAVTYALSLINESGVVSLRGARDWGRLTSVADQSSASMLLYRALIDAAYMTSWLADSSVSNQSSSMSATAEELQEKAEALRQAIMKEFWDSEAGAFRESLAAADLHPQDANSFALAYGIVEPGSEEATAITDYLASLWTPLGPASPELPNNVSPFISSVELEAHFRVGRPDRSLSLMRTLWGWYLNHENGTQSTTPEGFLLDGTWGYRYNGGYNNAPSYMSHAHCWSSGPTSTLTESLLGLRLTKPGGAEWLLRPATFGELNSVQAGYTTVLGKFSASFAVESDEVTVQWDTPEGTKGVIELPGRELEVVAGGRGSRKLPLA